VGKYEVVDGEGNSTGQLVETQIAHTTMVPHRVAGMLLHDADGKYVIQYRPPVQGIRIYDVSVGGHVDPGETPELAVVREAKEELNLEIDLASLDQIAKDMPVDDVYPDVGVYAHHLITWWHGQLPAGWKFVANDEVTDVVFMTKAEVIAHCQKYPEQWTKGLIASIKAMGWLT
jgi:8-oxo-dGTP pyrophosphatase MutT (NUDIX family)